MPALNLCRSRLTWRISGWRWTGKNLAGVEAAIDKDLHPQSFALPASLEVDLNVDVQREVKTVHNVGAYLPGNTPEYVIIGAHYDHLGLGEQFSLAPSLAGTVHPGADDNASGTAGVLELAQVVFARAETPARNFVSDFRWRGTGAARLQLLRKPSRFAVGECRRHDQHGHDRPHSRPEDLYRRRG